MSDKMFRNLTAAACVLLCMAAPTWGDYDVRVDLKNVSGQVKTNWPVVLRVYAVLGRNLDPASINPEGFHVYDASGKEVPHAIEKLPPYDQPGNDELIFVIPKMKPDEVVSYRVSNTSKRATKAAKIDVVNGPHNLIANGGFERAEGSRPAGFDGPAKLEGKVRHGGESSLVLSADDQEVRARHAKPIPLHKGSWYYFGVWSRMEKVSRFGYQARGGGYFSFVRRDAEQNKDVPAFAGSVTPQCSDRDWLKCTFASGVTDWGTERCHAQATGEAATVTFELRQRRHYYMEPGQTRGTWWLDDAVLMEQPEVTVRHDLPIAPLMKNGVFVFTRPPCMPLGRLDDKGRAEAEWCTFPFSHEKLTALDKFALKGQRVSYCVGVYHTRQIEDVLCRVADGALEGPDGAKLPIELIEYCPGYVGAGRGRYMQVLFERVGDKVNELLTKVDLDGEKGVRYFFLTFHVPKQARAQAYTGSVELLAGDKLLCRAPVRLRVQDMVQPIPDDVFVGMIFQGGSPPFNDEGLRVYSRSGFNCLTRFGGFLGYAKDESGAWQVDLDKLDKSMEWLKGYGMAGVAIFTDLDLGPKWNGGTMLKRVRPADFNQGNKPWSERLATAEKAYKAQIRRIEQARKAHPDWPELIYMTWDEPELHAGRNGRPDPAMAWVNQVAPKALTTLDVQFNPLPKCIQWYTAPAFDDPASWAGPELYRWVKKQGKGFGFCGSAREEGESARYQPGMMMIASGAKYFHAWHLGRPQRMARQMAYDGKAGRVVRAVSMINWGDGMSDLKAYHLLRRALADAAKDPAKRQAVKGAREYLAGVLAIFNGDHKPTWPNEPYLGTTSTWGCEGFYDTWQERMARHAATLKGVRWIE